MSDTSTWLGIIFFGVAALYAAVGQAGATGYLAAMSFFDFEPAAMKTTALSLNLLVAGVGTFQFWRSGLLAWRTVYPFGVLGIPFSLAGGAVQLPAQVYDPVIGAILLVASVQMFRSARRSTTPGPEPATAPPFLPSLLTGAVIGFISGTTGTGGGVFLAPVILTMNWASARRTAAISATYNLLNSAAALVGAYSILDAAPAALPWWLVAVGVGGTLGAYIGSRHLPEKALRHILATVLLVAGVKLLVL